MATTRKITNAEELQQAIKDLETRVQGHSVGIKQNYGQVKENLHPTRVAKNTFSYVAETPEIQRTLVNTAIGFILGYASKKAVELLTEDALDRTVHGIFNHHLTKLEHNRPESLLSKGISLFRRFTPPDSPMYPFVRYK